jgi:hypothetical protein
MKVERQVMVKALLGVLALAATAACVSGADAGGDTLTDAAITAYAAKPFDKGAMMFKHVVLGVHHGAHVVADFPCSDLCPTYTTRIIHYDLSPGPECAAASGVDAVRQVPMGIAVVPKHFCVPAVLAASDR